LPLKLTFYGQVNEVGSNKILLDDNDTHILLDFGKGFSRTAKYFEEYLSTKIANGVVDFIEMGLIPDVVRAFTGEDLLETAGPLPWTEAAQKSCGGHEEKGVSVAILYYVVRSRPPKAQSKAGAR
jgi:hypothetical protein